MANIYEYSGGGMITTRQMFDGNKITIEAVVTYDVYSKKADGTKGKLWGKTPVTFTEDGEDLHTLGSNIIMECPDKVIREMQAYRAMIDAASTAILNRDTQIVYEDVKND